jgi:hypothetical protein
MACDIKKYLQCKTKKGENVDFCRSIYKKGKKVKKTGNNRARSGYTGTTSTLVTNLSFFGRGSEGVLASSGVSATSASSRSGDLHVPPPPPSAPPPLPPPVSSLTAAGTRSITFQRYGWPSTYYSGCSVRDGRLSGEWVVQ